MSFGRQEFAYLALGVGGDTKDTKPSQEELMSDFSEPQWRFRFWRRRGLLTGLMRCQRVREPRYH